MFIDIAADLCPIIFKVIRRFQQIALLPGKDGICQSCENLLSHTGLNSKLYQIPQFLSNFLKKQDVVCIPESVCADFLNYGQFRLDLGNAYLALQQCCDIA